MSQHVPLEQARTFLADRIKGLSIADARKLLSTQFTEDGIRTAAAEYCNAVNAELAAQNKLADENRLVVLHFQNALTLAVAQLRTELYRNEQT